MAYGRGSGAQFNKQTKSLNRRGNNTSQQTLDLSLLNNESWTFSQGSDSNNKKDIQSTGYSVIKITPNSYLYGKNTPKLRPVVGTMLNNVALRVDSRWEEMGTAALPGFISNAVNKFTNAASTVSSITGGGDVGTIWRSKKIWKSNGDLSISPKFRVVDWDGTGLPLRYALIVAGYCLPVRTAFTGEMIKQLEGVVSQGINSGFNWLGEIIEKLPTDGASGVVSDIFKGLKNDIRGSADRVNTASKNYLDDMHDLLTLKNAPPPVKVQIGQYFFHSDMVVKGANFSFSHEVSDKGPLHVDITMDLVTRKRLANINDLGILPNTKSLSNRITVTSNTNVSNELGDEIDAAPGAAVNYKDNILKTPEKIDTSRYKQTTIA